VRITLPGWTGRSQVERVELYIRVSLYAILWLILVPAALGGAVIAERPLPVVGLVLGGLVLGVTSTMALRRAMALYPDDRPLPVPSLLALVALSLVAEGLIFLLPEDAQFSASLVVLASLTWGAGGLRDRRVQWGLYVVSPLIVFAPTGILGLAAYGLAMGLFLVFTVQSSLWLLDVVTQLDRARSAQSSLAVAEERLRFSRDVHDVLGRRLSTIAVQAELAAKLTERGDVRAVDQILEVRETAHVALREARELARGYRPLDLDAEVRGAVSLLRSAGIATTAELDGLPEEWHEPVARVIREAVTNVIRHSDASHVRLSYADREVVISNDGLARSAGTPRGPDSGLGSGTGLATLTDHLAPLGAEVTAAPTGEEFVVRVRWDDAAAPAEER